MSQSRMYRGSRIALMAIALIVIVVGMIVAADADCRRKGAVAVVGIYRVRCVKEVIR